MRKSTSIKGIYPILARKFGVYRIIDANVNRAKEGLRVCEEITRFILNSRSLTAALKKIRHKIDEIVKNLAFSVNLLKSRESMGDVGRNIYSLSELKRKNYQDIFSANIQRVKESIRVLEEFTKLQDIRIATHFKKLRYGIYVLEKKITQRLSSLYNHR